MDAVKFVLKSLLVTVVVVMIMQIKIGSKTVESHVNQTARQAGIIDMAQNFADGASRIVGQGWTMFVGGVDKVFSSRKHDGKFNFDRSREYLMQRADRANASAKDRIHQSAVGIDEDSKD